MRTIRRIGSFKRDFKREKSGLYQRTLDKELEDVLRLLVSDSAIPENYQDHAMRSSNGRDRNCHLRPDLILIYSKASPENSS